MRLRTFLVNNLTAIYTGMNMRLIIQRSPIIFDYHVWLVFIRIFGSCTVFTNEPRTLNIRRIASFPYLHSFRQAQGSHPRQHC